MVAALAVAATFVNHHASSESRSTPQSDSLASQGDVPEYVVQPDPLTEGI